MFDRDEHLGTIVMSVVVGAVVGAGVALLLAPQSGKRTRTRISHMAEDVRDMAEDFADRLKEKLG
jgi:gas vesicle protein